MNSSDTENTNQWNGFVAGVSPVISSGKSLYAAWMAHFVFFLMIFTGIGLYSVFSLVKSRKRKSKISRYLGITIYSLLAVFASTRIVYLILAQHEFSSEEFNKVLHISSRLINRMGFPCLTASFIFIDISFVDVVKMTSSRLRSIKFLFGVVAVHFTIDLTSVVLTSLVRDTSALFTVAVTYFLLAIVIIVVRITYSGRKILNDVKSNQNTLKDIELRASNTFNGTPNNNSKVGPPQDIKKALSKVRQVIIMTWISSSITVSLAIFTLYAMTSDKPEDSCLRSPITWLIVQTCYRVCEMLIVWTIIYAVKPSTEQMNSKKRCHRSRESVPDNIESKTN